MCYERRHKEIGKGAAGEGARGGAGPTEKEDGMGGGGVSVNGQLPIKQCSPIKTMGVP